MRSKTKRLMVATFCLMALLASVVFAYGTSVAQVPGGTLDPLSIPQFVEPLVILPSCPPRASNSTSPSGNSSLLRDRGRAIQPAGTSTKGH